MKLSPDAERYNVEIDQVDRSAWMHILSRFSDATLYQTWSYGSIRWGEENLSHLILLRDSIPVAAAQLVLRSIPLIGVGIAYAPWGPVWRTRAEQIEPRHLQRVLHELCTEYAHKRGLVLRLMPCASSTTDDHLIASMHDAGFVLNTSYPPYRTFLLDLSYSMQELRSALQRQWRQNLNKAVKNELRIIEGEGFDSYRIFMDLYRSMLERKDFTPGIDVNEFGEIHSSLPEGNKMIVKIAQLNDEPIAGIVASLIGSTGICLLAATNEKGLQYRAAYVLQWTMIEWMKSAGAAVYDLGGIDPEKNPGGFQYKKGLSGKLGWDVSFPGTYEYSDHWTRLRLIHTADFVRRFHRNVN